MSALPHQKFIKAFDNTATLDDIRTVYHEICRHYGFDHFTYVGRIPTSFVNPDYIYISGYPYGRQRRYREKYKKDPMAQHCVENITPIDWKNICETGTGDNAVSKFMREARNRGLRNGVSIPVHGGKGDSAVVSFAVHRKNNIPDDKINKSTPYLYLLSVYAHQAAMRVSVSNHSDQQTQTVLTRRERECLIWVAEGETAWDISNRLGIVESTVIFHLQNSIKKLGATNRQQAVAKAALMGLLLPEFK